MAETVRLQVNGVEREIAADPERPLLSVLRGTLGLTATHFGCGANQCGACYVLIDGRAVASCDTPLWAAAGKHVVTLEGLGTPEAPHPLQRAFIAEQAMQCGYCTSGVLMAAAALLQRNPAPGEAEVRQALDRNLCRCGAHNRMVRAVLRAAKEIAKGSDPSPAPRQFSLTVEARGQTPTASAPGAPTPAAGGRPLPGSLEANRRLSRWLRLRPDGTVEVHSGKVEIGQGILTALAQIVADELDVDLVRVRMVPATTESSPNEGVTSGSLSIQHSGAALRYAAAEARALYLGAAAQRLGVAADSLEVRDGEIAGPGNLRTSYWELADDSLLDRDATARVAPKAPAARRLAGAAVERIDIPDKVLGRPRFIHDLTLPGLLHARVLRPPSPGATLAALDDARARAVPGVVAVARDGSFAGIIAETEEAATAGLKALAVSATWQPGGPLPDEADLRAWIKSQPVETTPISTREAAAPGRVARTFRREYARPFIAHASMAPSCALAQWTDGAVRIWTHSQGVYNLRADLELILGLSPQRIVVEHAEGAGCYGQNGADDVALEAALLARAVPGRPVRLIWSREDELAWAPMGAAQLIDLEADLDEGGEIAAWRHDVWGNGHVSRPGRGKSPTLRVAWQLAKPFPRTIAGNPPLTGGGGSERNATPIYDLASWRIANHRILTMPIRTSALRTLGAFANVFAIESFMDELAAERGEDPLAFRLRHLKDARARAVLEAAALRAGWSSWQRREGMGHGLGLARYKGFGAYCAAVAEVEGEADIRVRRLVLAVDVGEVVNPDGVANQIEGGAVQAVSWVLKEAVRFDRERIVSDTWETYPILRFLEVPAVEVEIIARPEEKALGAGEAAHGPVAGAIANAVCDALGVRVRDLPITRERVIAAM
jgi:CO/xanthine dehydrogenase Mo-binding subunit/aerobic-type carbon monoxide dehydrogenase small subunit (CoxS/CutS family)